ncbi:centriole and centriolar satellite protein ofd1 [Aplochiton taeniatus]
MLQRVQGARRLDQEEFDSQRQVLQAQLQSEVERCAQLKGQLIECEERSQWMTTHADELKMQLRQTQQALENEVLRNPKPSLVDRSVLELSPGDRLLPPDIYVDRALLRPRRAPYDDMCEAGGVPSRGQRRGPGGRSVSPDSDTELLAGAKARIRELEKEADTLEEAYRNYQQRALQASVSHMLPRPRPLSPQRGPLASHRPYSPPRQPVFQGSRPHSAQRDQVGQQPVSPLRQQHTAHHTGPASPEPHYPTRTTSPSAHSARTSSPHQRTTSPHHTRTTSPAPQSRVTFSEDRLQHQFSGPVGDNGLQSFCTSEAQLVEETDAESASSPPPRRLSSTPLSLSRRQLHTEPAEESGVSPVPFPELSSVRQLSPPPRGQVASAGDFLSGLSPPCSPKLRSTARDDSSPPQVQQVFSSSESSPQPERIAMEDLTDPLEEPSSHIPELLLDTTAIPLTKEAPRDLPDTHLINTQGGVQQAPGGSDPKEKEKEEEDEELRWEQVRRERAARRQREQEEAQEREQRELERLEQERLLEEALQHGEGVEEQIERAEEPEGETEKAEPSEEKASEANPLEKYMKMVLEAREIQQVQSRGEENPGKRQSPEAKSLSEEKDDSIAAYSHEAVDDDFW